MKNIILISSFALSLLGTTQNVGVNGNNASPDVSAGLDVNFNNKGLLVPRLTTAERDAIQNPATSLLIYNTQTECFEAWSSSASTWASFGCIGCNALPPVTTATAGSDQNVNCNDDFTALAGNTPSVGTGAWTLVSGTGTITNSASPTSGVTGLNVPGMATFRWTISNGCGSSFDDVVITTCTPSFSCGNSFTDSRDSETYQTVQIGSQCWMAENLNYGTPSYGNSWCYNNNSSNCTTYGRLYDWDAAMNNASSSSSNPSGVQGICPNGWHLPSDAEWCQMENAVEPGTDASCNTTGYRGTNTGKNLKTNTWGGDNASGFTGLSAGRYNGSFANMGTRTYFWSATENGTNAWSRFLNSTKDGVFRDSYSKTSGYSIRCIED